MVKSDKLAYLCWMSGSIAWVLGFLYQNEHKIDIVSSSLSRGIIMYFFNAIWINYQAFLLPSPSIANSECAEKTVYPMDPRDTLIISCRHIYLTIYGFVFSECQFYLPSPIIYTIYFSSPLSVLSLEFLIFNRKVNRREALGVIISLIGVVLTSNGMHIKSFFTG